MSKNETKGTNVDLSEIVVPGAMLEIEDGDAVDGDWLIDCECDGCDGEFYVDSFSGGFYRCPHCGGINGVDWDESYDGYSFWNWAVSNE